MLHYFGTELDRTGHYFWLLERDSISKWGRGLMDFSKCPFNPEALPYKAQRNGETQFYQFAGFSIWAIEGSCKDSRPSSRSIFFVEQIMSKEELKALILATSIAKKMVEKMPFQVEW